MTPAAALVHPRGCGRCEGLILYALGIGACIRYYAIVVVATIVGAVVLAPDNIAGCGVEILTAAAIAEAPSTRVVCRCGLEGLSRCIV